MNTSGASVGAELRPAPLVVHRHDDQLRIDAVAHGVREPDRFDSSFHDLAVLVVDRWRAGVRPLSSAFDRQPDRSDEPVTETRHLLLVPLPRVDDVPLSQRVNDNREIHTRGLGATLVDRLKHVLPRHRRRFTRREVGGSTGRLDRPKVFDFTLLDVDTIETREQAAGELGSILERQHHRLLQERLGRIRHGTSVPLAERHAGVLSALFRSPVRPIPGEPGRLTSFEFIEPFERLLADGNIDGSLRSADPSSDATLLANAVTWTYLHMRQVHQWSPERTARQVIDLATAHLLPR